jgi:histidyl-tRNA synthetase
MITKPRGTVDILGKKMRELVALKLIIRNIMDLYNFEEIETPIFESLDLFKRAVGEETDIVSKEMFTFEDRKGRQLALRPEGTAPTVRMVLEEKLFIPENLPLKMFYFGPMFRYERPQNGRQRQFTQFGVEVYGSNEYVTDVETISLSVEILKAIGITDLSCHINYLVSGDERKKYVEDLKNALKDKPLCEDCKVRFEKNPLRVLDCKIDGDKFGDVISMKDYLSVEDQEKFDAILASLKQIGIECVVDKLLVRGLDYYTGVVFEIKSHDKNLGAQSTMLGGGRYNKLVEELGGPSLPAVGFAIGLERVLLALESVEDLAASKSVDAFIFPIGKKAEQASILVSTILRSAGISCDLNHLNKNLKSAFKLVERMNAKNIIIIGDEELKNNSVTIKNQETKIETKVSFDKIVDYFAE